MGFCWSWVGLSYFWWFIHPFTPHTISFLHHPPITSKTIHTIHLSTPSIHPHHPSIHTIHPSIHPSTPSIHPSIHPSTPSIHPSIYPHHPSIHPSTPLDRLQCLLVDLHLRGSGCHPRGLAKSSRVVHPSFSTHFISNPFYFNPFYF